MGQLKAEHKSNESKSIPKLIHLLDIKGCLVSIDAMGCQTQIAEKILHQGGGHLLAVKGHQERLYCAVKQVLAAKTTASSTTENVTIEQDHGRIEAREYHVLPADELGQQFPAWKGIKSLGVAMDYCLEKSGKESLAYRYYISSAELELTRFAAAVRDLWILDVSMCAICRGDSADILACMQHLFLNMLRAETNEKASIRRKRKMTSMSSAYMDKVLMDYARWINSEHSRSHPALISALPTFITAAKT